MSEESRWELPEDITKYANNYIFLKTIWKKMSQNGNPASTNIGRSKDLDDSYLTVISVK